jgi:hypothetical protein
MGILIPHAWTDALGISEGTYHLVAAAGGLIAGAAATLGFLVLVVRRARFARVRVTTTRWDLVTFFLLAFGIATGMICTIWGTLGEEVRYRETVAPYFRSLFALDPEINSKIVSLAEKMSDRGAVVEEISSPVDCRQLLSAYATLLFSITHADSPPIQNACFALLRGPAKLACAFGAKPVSWAHGILGATASHREWLEAHTIRTRMGQQIQSLFARHDIVLAPVSVVGAFRHDHRPIQMRKLRCSDGRSVPWRHLSGRWTRAGPGAGSLGYACFW